MTVAGSPFVASRPKTAPSGLIAIVEKIATSLGVDPNLALATMKVESGGNPTAVGDGGTSFGLFQLHEGGELGSMTAQQAFNPATNAQTALSQFAAVQAANPTLTDPGSIAAAAQRPANPGGYAAEVNYYYAQLAAGVPFQSLKDYSGAGSSSAGTGTGSTPISLTDASMTGCAAKGEAFKVPGVSSIPLIGRGAGLSWCQVKGLTGGFIMLSGAALMVFGVAAIIVAGLSGKGPAAPIKGIATDVASVTPVGKGSEAIPKSASTEGRRIPAKSVPSGATTMTKQERDYASARARGRANAREAGPFPEAA